MINEYKYSLFVVKTSFSRKERRKRGLNKYTGIMLDAGSKLCSIPVFYNKLGSLVYAMNDLVQSMIARDDKSFSIASGDYRDSEDDIDKARQDYIEYCSIGDGLDEADESTISYTGKEEIKKIDLDITINNEGLEPFLNKDGVPITRVSFSNTASGIKPKFRNTRDKTLLKAYELSYKGVF